jgi:hypothetical protein
MVPFPAVVTEESDHRCMLGLCPLDLGPARTIPEIWVLVSGDLAGETRWLGCRLQGRGGTPGDGGAAGRLWVRVPRV